MIQIENVEEGRIRFATKNPSSIEVMLVDGKMFVHSEPLKAKSTSIKNDNKNKSLSKNQDNKELEFSLETKTS